MFVHEKTAAQNMGLGLVASGQESVVVRSSVLGRKAVSNFRSMGCHSRTCPFQLQTEYC